VRLVFIGRISAIKNLKLALIALRGLSQPVDFDIYGPVEDAAYWSGCRAVISQLPAATRVAYRGEVAPAEVRRTFADYDAFVFPTLGENFGHVIAESLSASCPVLCSDRTPWTAVLEAGGGVVVRDLDADGLRRELERVVAMTPADRLKARHMAGAVYRSWRQGSPEPNILERARIAPWSAHPEGSL
jgi:glycosyltransferase involved in cell wall biosynthesis